MITIGYSTIVVLVAQQSCNFFGHVGGFAVGARNWSLIVSLAILPCGFEGRTFLVSIGSFHWQGWPSYNGKGGHLLAIPPFHFFVGGGVPLQTLIATIQNPPWNEAAHENLWGPLACQQKEAGRIIFQPTKSTKKMVATDMVVSRGKLTHPQPHPIKTLISYMVYTPLKTNRSHLQAETPQSRKEKNSSRKTSPGIHLQKHPPHTKNSPCALAPNLSSCKASSKSSKRKVSRCSFETSWSRSSLRWNRESFSEPDVFFCLQVEKKKRT